jgi:hypothetical protein
MLNELLGPYSMQKKLIDRYVRLILTEFFMQLTEEERSYTWFQQDSAITHTTDNSLAALEEVFVDRIISYSLYMEES